MFGTEAELGDQVSLYLGTDHLSCGCLKAIQIYSSTRFGLLSVDECVLGRNLWVGANSSGNCIVRKILPGWAVCAAWL